jgi:pimeloyl-ACP methyl ester carboxylesterase
MSPVFGTIAALAGVVAVSYLVEALRRAPQAPDILPWAPDIPIRHVSVSGIRLRYIEVGHGPTLVLLHPMRTQLDLFQPVIPALAARYRVYAIDLPGHGYSDIPAADYTASFFIGIVAEVFEQLDVEEAVLVGESIGGTIALGLAARRHPRVRAVVAINPYDYDRGRGLQRVSPLAWLLLAVNDVPVVVGTFARLRQYRIVKHVLDGGLHRERGLPPSLGRELYGWETGRATRARSRRWSTTGPAGRRSAHGTATSAFRYCYSTGSTTGRAPRSARRRPAGFRAPRPTRSCRRVTSSRSTRPRT